VVEGLTKRDIHPNKCTERGAQTEGTDGVCDEVEEDGGEEVGQSRLNWHADEDIAWFCNVSGTAAAGAKKLRVRGHGMCNLYF
jgi:hypothetical protein